MKTKNLNNAKEMKYSEYLTSIIQEGIPFWQERYVGTYYMDNIYLCHIISCMEEIGIGKTEFHKKLRKTIKRKMNGKFTLSCALKEQVEKVGHTQARINWILKLAEINRKKGN